MAEKKEHKITKVESTVETAEKKEATHVEASGANVTGLRIGAIICWVFALLFEVLAYMMITGKWAIKGIPTMTQMIIALVLDLGLVILGSQLWKKANHIKPVSEKNKAKFWLWNNMGVIVCCIAFIPFVILLLTNKELDKKTKTIGVVIAIIACLIGGVSSYDWNPVSSEQLEAATQTITDDVYWTKYGKVYHTHEDCQALNNSDELFTGDVATAIENNKSRLCSFCAKKDDITTVATDNVDTTLYDEAA